MFSVNIYTLWTPEYSKTLNKLKGPTDTAQTCSIKSRLVYYDNKLN